MFDIKFMVRASMTDSAVVFLLICAFLTCQCCGRGLIYEMFHIFIFFGNGDEVIEQSQMLRVQGYAIGNVKDSLYGNQNDIHLEPQVEMRSTNLPFKSHSHSTND